VESPHLGLPVAFEDFEDAAAIASIQLACIAGARRVCAHLAVSRGA
jgi:hypothetical protein